MVRIGLWRRLWGWPLSISFIFTGVGDFFSRRILIVFADRASIRVWIVFGREVTARLRFFEALPSR
ncbi:hypothetical protein AGR4C_pb30012 [Agrobacterium tumefaciens str. Kerr 14]|uniref:Uncharacterized protein n=1 Tax=Agrobacterium tumefaciens str. Kerr 14 TaxID=1183424 RepID=A0A1S7SEC9_AGRTU|nr:hypothetical protein AGR4C_pb30012 [Agrobacterium tumefaciens str. Kerr 14]